ncbi:MAG: hypothetical protein J7K32_01625, partial [Deltaproteobacteria bacterium]|nr:hypothetical protein [Deltaproteobacteria bacterium]
MKYLSFKILMLCIILPPVFYIFTMQLMENQFQKRYTDEIKDIYIGDTKPLFDGRISLKVAIKKNIDQYLLNQILPGWGADLRVVVTANHETILYPDFSEEDDDSMPVQDPMRLATENYNLLNEGLKIIVDLEIHHNTLISNAIIIFYILISVMVFYYYYTAGIKRIKAEEGEKNRKIGRLIQNQEKYTSRIEKINVERQKLSKELNIIKKELNNEKIKADKTEIDMIDEIVVLEKEIEESLSLQHQQQNEIELLREDLERLEKSKY